MAFQVFLKRRTESIKNQKLLTGLKTRDFANISVDGAFVTFMTYTFMFPPSHSAIDCL
jgi:hypothetical protein